MCKTYGPKVLESFFQIRKRNFKTGMLYKVSIHSMYVYDIILYMTKYIFYIMSLLRYNHKPIFISNSKSTLFKTKLYMLYVYRFLVLQGSVGVPINLATFIYVFIHFLFLVYMPCTYIAILIQTVCPEKQVLIQQVGCIFPLRSSTKKSCVILFTLQNVVDTFAY